MEGVGCDPLLQSLTNLGDEVGAAAAVGTAAVPLGLSHNQVCFTGCLCREAGDLEFASSDSGVEFSSGHGSSGHESFRLTEASIRGRMGVRMLGSDSSPTVLWRCHQTTRAF